MTFARKKQLSKGQRISSSSDFGRVYAAGESAPGRYLVLWRFRRPEEECCARVGVVASKRSIGKAHDRNRAKRLLREAFRNRADLFADGFDYVLIARRHIAGAKLSDVVSDLQKVVGRMK